MFPDWQFMLVDPGDQAILAAGLTVPVAWDGTDADLGPGIEATIAAVFRMGARIGPAIPKSLHISGTVADWESWTNMRFPETGDYVFPEGLATVRIDWEQDTGEYWEPNMWLIHEVSAQA